MSFVSPLMLFALLPLAALAIWLMRRRADEIAVPFLPLWPPTDTPAAASPRQYRLPLWVALVMLAAVMAILAASGPHFGATWKRRVHVVIDRGAGMSAEAPGGGALYEASLRSLFDDASLALEAVSITVIPPLEANMARLQGPVSAAKVNQAISRTAVDTLQLVQSHVAAARNASDATTVVLTDHRLKSAAGDGGGVIIVPPTMRAANAGIAFLAAADLPAPQVMVTPAFDESTPAIPARSRTLIVKSGDETHERPIPAGAALPVFIDFTRLGDTVEAILTQHAAGHAAGDFAGHDRNVATDGFPPDDRAWLVRGTIWPWLAAGRGVHAEVARFADVYNGLRHPAATSGASGEAMSRTAGDQSSHVVHLLDRIEPAVQPSPTDLAPASAMVFPVLHSGQRMDTGEIEIISPLGGGIDWRRILEGALCGPEPDASWEPRVRVGGRTVLAERALALDGSPPARQVLFNFWSEALTSQPEFVVLLGSVADSFGSTSPMLTPALTPAFTPAFVGESLIVPPAPWQRLTPAIEGYTPSPGIYRDEAGKLRALNSLFHRPGSGGTAATPEPPPASPPRVLMESLPITPTAGHPAAAWLTPLALASLVAGLLARGKSS